MNADKQRNETRSSQVSPDFLSASARASRAAFRALAEYRSRPSGLAQESFAKPPLPQNGSIVIRVTIKPRKRR